MIDLEVPLKETQLPTKQYYTLAETADIIGISKRTLQRWIKTGKIETYQTTKKRGQVLNYKVFSETISRSTFCEALASGREAILNIQGYLMFRAKSSILL